MRTGPRLDPAPPPLGCSAGSLCHRDTYLEQQQTEKIETEVRDVYGRRITKDTLAVQGSRLGGHMGVPVRHKHMLYPLPPPGFSSPLINEDLPQLVITFNNWFFRHQACYSLLQTGQAKRRYASWVDIDISSSASATIYRHS
jgi:hypothetical protein